MYIVRFEIGLCTWAYSIVATIMLQCMGGAMFCMTSSAKQYEVMLCRQTVLHSCVWGLLHGSQLCSTLPPPWHPLANTLRDVIILSLVNIQVCLVSTSLICPCNYAVCVRLVLWCASHNPSPYVVLCSPKVCVPVWMVCVGSQDVICALSFQLSYTCTTTHLHLCTCYCGVFSFPCILSGMVCGIVTNVYS